MERIVRILSKDDIYDYENKYQRVKDIVETLHEDNMAESSFPVQWLSVVANIHDTQETYYILSKVMDEFKGTQ